MQSLISYLMFLIFPYDLLKGGWSPLHVAAWKDRRECIQLLLSRGADINVKTDVIEINE